MRFDKTKKIKLRTKPIGHHHVTLGSKGWRTFPRRSEISGPLVPPGNYTVVLTVGEKKAEQTIVVRKDPHSAGSAEDIQEQTRILKEICQNINIAAEMINQIEWIRKQIYDLKKLLEDNKKSDSIIKAADELDKKLIDVEGFFYSMELTGSGDSLRCPDKFYVKLRFLARDISKSDFPPTTQQLEVHQKFKRQLADYKRRLEELVKKDVMAFNGMLKEENIHKIITKIY